MNTLNIGDYVQIHLAGAAAGSLGDNSVVEIIKIEEFGQKVVYTGMYGKDCGAGAIQFTESECTIIRHTQN